MAELRQFQNILRQKRPNSCRCFVWLAHLPTPTYLTLKLKLKLLDPQDIGNHNVGNSDFTDNLCTAEGHSPREKISLLYIPLYLGTLWNFVNRRAFELRIGCLDFHLLSLLTFQSGRAVRFLELSRSLWLKRPLP